MGDEEIIYVGDTGRYPYGPRPAEEVRRFSREIAKHLVGVEDVKMIVVACNTAASVALDELRYDLEIPVVGSDRAGVRAAAAATRNGEIGVIGTTGTIARQARTSGPPQRCAAQGVHFTACPGLVEFVERGELDGDSVHVLAERLLSPLREAGVDTLLFGYTRFPFLGPDDQRRNRS